MDPCDDGATVKVRILEPTEHEKVIGHGPFERVTLAPDPETSSIVVAEDESGKLLGFWCAFNAVHLEPLWVREDVRNNGIGMALWSGILELCAKHRVQNAFAFVADADAMVNLPLAAKLGFHRLPVSALFIDLTKDPRGH